MRMGASLSGLCDHPAIASRARARPPRAQHWNCAAFFILELTLRGTGTNVFWKTNTFRDGGVSRQVLLSAGRWAAQVSGAEGRALRLPERGAPGRPLRLAIS